MKGINHAKFKSKNSRLYRGGYQSLSKVTVSVTRHLLCASLSLFFVAASCQAPLSPTASGDFRVLKNDKENPASLRKSLVPAEILYIHGDPADLFPEGIPEDLAKLPRHVDHPGFHTLATPVDTACNSNCGFNSMSVGLSWPQPGYGPSGAHLSLDVANTYSYGLAVRSTGTNASGQTIATEIAFNYRVAIVRDLSYPRFNPHTFLGPFILRSTDGIHFTLASNSIGYKSIQFSYSGSVRADGQQCQASHGSSATQAPTSASLTLIPMTSNSSLPTTGSAIFNAATNGQGLISWGTLFCADEDDYTRGVDVPGTFSSSASLNVGVYFNAPLPQATPSPTSTPTPTPLPTHTPTPSPTATVTPVPSGTSSPFPSITPFPSPLFPIVDSDLECPANLDQKANQLNNDLTRLKNEISDLEGGFRVQLAHLVIPAAIAVGETSAGSAAIGQVMMAMMVAGQLSQTTLNNQQIEYKSQKDRIIEQMNQILQDPNLSKAERDSQFKAKRDELQQVIEQMNVNQQAIQDAEFQFRKLENASRELERLQLELYSLMNDINTECKKPSASPSSSPSASTSPVVSPTPTTLPTPNPTTVPTPLPSTSPNPSPSLIFPTPQPTNIDEISDPRHRRRLRKALAESGEVCVDKKNNTSSLEPEDAHHVVPLNYEHLGMGAVHEILAACDIDIDDVRNGVCMDHDSHKQTLPWSPNNRESYVQQIMIIFNETVDDQTREVDCDRVRDNLATIKEHLKDQNTISQNGGTPNVDLAGLGL